jgi:hypothetical protein
LGSYWNFFCYREPQSHQASIGHVLISVTVLSY